MDMYFQHEAPSEDKFANWLPIPKDKFWAVIRFYAPKQDVVDGEYTPPALQVMDK